MKNPPNHIKDPSGDVLHVIITHRGRYNFSVDDNAIGTVNVASITRDQARRLANWILYGKKEGE